MSNWEYGEIYKKYNMDGIIEIGTGMLKVHDIFDTLPDFIKEADCLFIDPPCSLGNLNSFYTKADMRNYKYSYDPFETRLFECIDEIDPKKLFIEVFKSNKDRFEKEVKSRFTYVETVESTYYHNKKNVCWIICASKEPLQGMPKIDEEDFIAYICKNVDYECIGDLCMGRGLVGWNAYKNGKRFVGTELNKKRLAVLVDKITKDKEFLRSLEVDE